MKSFFNIISKTSLIYYCDLSVDNLLYTNINIDHKITIYFICGSFFVINKSEQNIKQAFQTLAGLITIYHTIIWESNSIKGVPNIILLIYTNSEYCQWHAAKCQNDIP